MAGAVYRPYDNDIGKNVLVPVKYAVVCDNRTGYSRAKATEEKPWPAGKRLVAYVPFEGDGGGGGVVQDPPDELLLEPREDELPPRHLLRFVRVRRVRQPFPPATTFISSMVKSLMTFSDLDPVSGVGYSIADTFNCIRQIRM